MQEALGVIHLTQLGVAVHDSSWRLRRGSRRLRQESKVSLHSTLSSEPLGYLRSVSAEL